MSMFKSKSVLFFGDFFIWFPFSINSDVERQGILSIVQMINANNEQFDDIELGKACPI